jgi:repressor LexA
MAGMALTRRQKEVLEYIAKFLQDNGYSPSYEEIAHGLELASLATVHKHLQALELKGYLRRGFNQSRSVEIADKYIDEQRRMLTIGPARAESTDGRGISVPLLGRIAAGAPVETYAAQSSLNLKDFAGDSDTYALEVRGESMIDDHICNGDFVLISKTDHARDGEIVVALVDGAETTLKRLYREGDMTRLQPANSTMEPIRVPAANVQVQGKVLAVLRKY